MLRTRQRQSARRMTTRDRTNIKMTTSMQTTRTKDYKEETTCKGYKNIRTKAYREGITDKAHTTWTKETESCTTWTKTNRKEGWQGKEGGAVRMKKEDHLRTRTTT